MELSKYIETTLSQIIDGVRNTAKNGGYLVAPYRVNWGNGVSKDYHEPSIVEFEVSVEFERGGGVDIGLQKIIVANFKGAKNNMNRVKFSVPVHYFGSNSKEDDA